MTKPDPTANHLNPNHLNPEPHHGFRDLLGYRLVDWQDALAVVELTLTAAHSNRSGLVHGGVYMALLDTACGYAGCYCPVPGHVRRCVTLSLNTNFLGQVRLGETIRATGQVVGGGRKVFGARAELRGPAGKVLATAEGMFQYRRGSEHADGVPE